MADRKISATMSTQIALDLVSASKSVKSMTNLVNTATNAWKAQEAELRSTGDYLKAAQTRYDGLGEAIIRQQSKIEGLKEKQSQLKGNTVETANQYLKYQQNIDKATTQLAHMQAQQSRASDSIEKQKLGLYDLNKQVELSSKNTDSYSRILEAQGAKFQAQKAKLTGLTETHSKMSNQIKAEQQLLSHLGSEYGQTSSQYQTQAVKVNELTAKYKENEAEVKTLNRAVGGYSDKMLKIKDVSANATASLKKGWENVRSAALASTVVVGTFTAALVSGAKKASTLQNSYKVTSNLLVTGGEKVAEVTKNVAKMQSDGQKYSVAYGKSQSAIAEQYQELVKRGYSSAEALGAMKTELQGSVASGDDFNDVVKVSSQVIDAFGERTNNTAKMTANTKKTVNELAYSADMTATDFQSLGKGMEYVGDSAHSAGFKLSETSAAMGILSNHGLEADKAGTGLRKVVNSISGALEAQEVAQKGVGKSIEDYNDKISKHQRKINELTEDVKKGTKTQKAASSAIQTQKDDISDLTEKIQQAKQSSGGTSILNKLGIKRSELVDANGNMRDLSTIMAVVNQKTKDMGTAQKNAVFNSLFGTTGQQAGIILAQNNKELSDLTDKVQKAGEKGTYVQTLAQKNSATAQQSIKRFKQAWSELEIMFGAKLLPYMTDAANKLSKLFADKDFVKSLEKDADNVGEIAKNVYHLGVYAGEHLDTIETLAKVVATIWAIDKVRKFARATEDLFDLMGIGKSKILEETEQVQIQTKAYQELAVAKGEAASVGETGGVSSTASAASSEVGSLSGTVSKEASTLAKGSKWNLLGSTVAGRIINGAGLALTAWDVGSSITKAVNSKSATAKYAAAGKTTGTLIGGGIGAVFGGPAGAMLGATIGDQIGGSKTVSNAIEKFVKNWNKNIVGVKLKTPKLSTKSSLDTLEKAQKKYYANHAKQVSADNELLYKEGYITKQQYDARTKVVQQYTKKENTISSMSHSKQLKLAKQYASDKQEVDKKYNAQRSKLLTKYDRDIRYEEEYSGKNSVATKKLIAEKKKALDKIQNAQDKATAKLTQKYSTDTTTTYQKNQNKITSLIASSSTKQKTLLQKLANDSKNINANNAKSSIASATKEYNEVTSLANKKYKKIKDLADKQYDAVKSSAEKQQKSAIDSASKQYTETLKASERQFKGNSDYAVKQRQKIAAEASKQYEDTVDSANKQYNETVSHAKKQHDGTVSSAEKQRVEIVDKADAQKTKVVESASAQSKGVLGHAVSQANGSMEAQSKQGKGTMSIWTAISKWWNGLAKDFGVETIKSDKGDFSYSAMSMPAYATGVGAINRNQMALVGEAGAELAYKPYSGTARILGAKGAEVTQLQKGEMILNAVDTKKVMSGAYTGVLPAYAKGSSSLLNFINNVKNGAESIWDNVSDKALDLLDTIKNPTQFLENIASKAFNLTSIPNVGSTAQNFSAGITKKGIEAVGSVLQKLIDNEAGSANPSGSGVKRWTNDVKIALKKIGLPSTDAYVNAWLKQIETESSGNPKAIQGNIGDINNKTGDLAKGLLQTISTTFNAYKLAGHSDIFNGYDNMLAAMNYAKSRYGSKMLSVIGRGHGYENGGIISQHGIYEIAEKNKPEMVLPLTDQSRASQLLDSIGASYNSEKSRSTDVNSNEDVKELSSKLDTLTSMFGTLLTLVGENVKATKANMNKNDLYKQMAKDMGLASYQAK
ncbi:phage tail tape measure protein [Liquorilactobacillus hordei]|uniref:phage tail tape measure protein n=1 Tax=Liquorilactobacillus hordei TaxID=468911 RepID=UPI0039EA4431